MLCLICFVCCLITVSPTLNGKYLAILHRSTWSCLLFLDAVFGDQQRAPGTRPIQSFTFDSLRGPESFSFEVLGHFPVKVL